MEASVPSPPSVVPRLLFLASSALLTLLPKSFLKVSCEEAVNRLPPLPPEVTLGSAAVVVSSAGVAGASGVVVVSAAGVTGGVVRKVEPPPKSASVVVLTLSRAKTLS